MMNPRNRFAPRDSHPLIALSSLVFPVGLATNTTFTARVNVHNFTGAYIYAPVYLRYRRVGTATFTDVAVQYVSGSNNIVTTDFLVENINSNNDYYIETSLSPNYPGTIGGTLSYTYSTTVLTGPYISGAILTPGTLAPTSFSINVTVNNPDDDNLYIYSRYRVQGTAAWNNLPGRTAISNDATIVFTMLEGSTIYDLEFDLTNAFNNPVYASIGTTARTGINPFLTGLSLVDGSLTHSEFTVEATLGNPDGIIALLFAKYTPTTGTPAYIHFAPVDTTGTTAMFRAIGLTPETEYRIEVSLADDYPAGNTRTRTLNITTPVETEPARITSISLVRGSLGRESFQIRVTLANPTSSTRIYSRHTRQTGFPAYTNLASVRATSSTVTLPAILGLDQDIPYAFIASVSPNYPNNPNGIPGDGRTHVIVIRPTSPFALRRILDARVVSGSITETSLKGQVTVSDTGFGNNQIYYRWRPSTETAWSRIRTVNAIPSAQFTISGLTPGVRYDVQVSLSGAFTEGGGSGLTEAFYPTTLATSIAPMTGISLVPGSLTNSGFTVQGTIANPDNEDTTLYARWTLADTPQPEYTTLSAVSTTQGAVTFEISGLSSSTNYRVEISNAGNYPGFPGNTRQILITTNSADVTPPTLSGISIISGSLMSTSVRIQIRMNNPDSVSTNIYARYRLNLGGGYTNLTTESTTGTSLIFDVDELDEGTQYRIEMSLVANFPDSNSRTRTITVTTPGGAVAPLLTSIRIVSGSLTHNSVRVQVTLDNPDEQSATLYARRRLNSGGNYTVLASQTTIGESRTFSFTGLQSNTEYRMEISLAADYPDGDSITRGLYITTQVAVMDPLLTGISMVPGSVTSTSVEIQVTLDNPDEQTATLYRRRRLNSGGAYTALTTHSTIQESYTYTFDNLSPDTAYRIQISLFSNYPVSLARTRTIVITTGPEIVVPTLSELNLVDGSLSPTGFRVQAILNNPDRQSVTLYRRHADTDMVNLVWIVGSSRLTSGTVETFQFGNLAPETHYDVVISTTPDFSAATSITVNIETGESTSAVIAVTSVTLYPGYPTHDEAWLLVNYNNPDNNLTPLYRRYRDITNNGPWVDLSTEGNYLGTSAILVITGLSPGREYEFAVSTTVTYTAETTAMRRGSTVALVSITGISVVGNSINQASARFTVTVNNPLAELVNIYLRRRVVNTNGTFGPWQAVPYFYIITTNSVTVLEENFNAGTEYQVQASTNAAFLAVNTMTVTFSTLPNPTVASLEVSASTITLTSFTVRVILNNPNNLIAVVYLRWRTVEYDIDGNEVYGLWSFFPAPITTTDDAVHYGLNNLMPGTRYEMEASTSNAFSVGLTESVRADTPALPSFIPIYELRDPIGHTETGITFHLHISNFVDLSPILPILFYFRAYETSVGNGTIVSTLTSFINVSDSYIAFNRLMCGTEYTIEASLTEVFDPFPAAVNISTLECPPPPPVTISEISIVTGSVTQTSVRVQVLLNNSEGQSLTLFQRYRISDYDIDGNPDIGAWIALDNIETVGTEETFEIEGLDPNTRYEIQVHTDDTFDLNTVFSLLVSTLVPEGLPPPTFRLELHTALQDRIRFNVILSRALAPGEEPLTLYLRAFAGTDRNVSWYTSGLFGFSTSRLITATGLTPDTPYVIEASETSDFDVVVVLNARTLPEPMEALVLTLSLNGEPGQNRGYFTVTFNRDFNRGETGRLFMRATDVNADRVVWTLEAMVSTIATNWVIDGLECGTRYLIQVYLGESFTVFTATDELAFTTEACDPAPLAVEWDFRAIPVVHVGDLIDRETFTPATGLHEVGFGVNFGNPNGATLADYLTYIRTVRMYFDYSGFSPNEEISLYSHEALILTRIINNQLNYQLPTKSNDWSNLFVPVDSIAVTGTATQLELSFLDVDGHEVHEDAIPTAALTKTQPVIVRTADGRRRVRKVEWYPLPEYWDDEVPQETWYYGLWSGKGMAFNGPPYNPMSSVPFEISNGRDSAISLSPPEVPRFSGTVFDRANRITLDTSFPVYGQSETPAETRWPEAQTNTPARIILDKHFGAEWLLDGVAYQPSYVHREGHRYINMAGSGKSALMTQNNLFNVSRLYTPRDQLNIGGALREVFHAYASQYAGVNVDDILESEGTNAFNQTDWPMKLGFWWTNWEAPWSLISRLIATQGPPASFFENRRGRIVLFSGRRGRNRPLGIGATGQLELMGPVSIMDHVTDIANDAVIPVQLKGFILPSNVVQDGQHLNPVNISVLDTDALHITEQHLLEGDDVAPSLLFHNLTERYWYEVGGGIRTILVGENVEYRVDNGNPFIVRKLIVPDLEGVVGNADRVVPLAPTLLSPPNVAGLEFHLEVLNGSTVQIRIFNDTNEPKPVPALQLLGIPLNSFTTVEYWTNESTRQHAATQASRRRHRYRQFQYAGYTSIYPQAAQSMANWVVEYYREGIRTATLQVYVPHTLRAQLDAASLEPLKPITLYLGPEYTTRPGGAFVDMLVRTMAHKFIGGEWYVDLVLDENIDDRTRRSPLLSGSGGIDDED